MCESIGGENNPCIPTYILVSDNGSEYVQGKEFSDVLLGVRLRDFRKGREIYDALYRKFQNKNFECENNESGEHSIVVSQLIKPKPWIDKGYFVLAPDSDFTPVFKEVEISNGMRMWLMAYDELVLHYYSWAVKYGDEEEWKEDYLSTHQINSRERIEAKKEREEVYKSYKMAQELNDELFEEAGYDFID